MVDTINVLKPSGCFEIQKIIGVSTIHGRYMSYQVQWAPSWISGAHLIGCEDLIEQFECEQDDKEPDKEVDYKQNDRMINNKTFMSDDELENETSVLTEEAIQVNLLNTVNITAANSTAANNTAANSTAANIKYKAINCNESRSIKQKDPVVEVHIVDFYEDHSAVTLLNEENHMPDDSPTEENLASHLLPQSKVSLKSISLDSVIQQISERSKLQQSSIDRNVVHPDFWWSQADMENVRDVKDVSEIYH